MIDVNEAVRKEKIKKLLSAGWTKEKLQEMYVDYPNGDYKEIKKLKQVD